MTIKIQCIQIEMNRDESLIVFDVIGDYSEDNDSFDKVFDYNADGKLIIQGMSFDKIKQFNINEIYQLELG